MDEVRPAVGSRMHALLLVAFFLSGAVALPLLWMAQPA